MIENPNLSIIVPGGCNARCNFCFWKRKHTCAEYLDRLDETLAKMPPQFRQISLTGGEPTLSAHLEKILERLDRTRWPHIVMTTNGTRLSTWVATYPDLAKKLTAVNISRHHHDDRVNEEIFDTCSVPNKPMLENVIRALERLGVPVTFNCVLTAKMALRTTLLRYIQEAKALGAVGVCFRKPHGTLDPAEQEALFADVPVDFTGGCPVCRTKGQTIEGLQVLWKTSFDEPSAALGEVYETIIHPNGKITADWAGTIPFRPEEYYMNPKDEALKKLGEALQQIGKQLVILGEAPTPKEKTTTVSGVGSFGCGYSKPTGFGCGYHRC